MPRVGVHGGDILTMEGDDAAYAEALVIEDGTIVFVGTRPMRLPLPDRARRCSTLQARP